MGTHQVIRLLRHLQDAYASLCGLTIFITDCRGRVFSGVCGKEPLARLLLDDKQSLLSAAWTERVIGEIGPIDRTILYQNDLGMNLIIAPVSGDTGPAYYIWAGVLIQKQYREPIRRLLELGPDAAIWTKAIDETPDTPDEDKQLHIERMMQMAQIASSLHQLDAKQSNHNYYIRVLTGWFDRHNVSSKSSIRSAVEMAARLLHFDFAAYAEAISAEKLRVTAVEGGGVYDSLHGMVIYRGEGFVGQTALTGQAGCWDKVRFDPRAAAFAERDISLHHLTCYPVRSGGTLHGVLFGGIVDTSRAAAPNREAGQLLAASLASRLGMVSLSDTHNQSMTRYSTLLEVCQASVDITDIQTLLSLLADVSQSIVQGKFCCLVLRQDGYGGIRSLASRGLSSPKAERYAAGAAARHFASTAGTCPTRCPVSAETDWGDPVHEYPLVWDNRVQGVLGVAYRDETDSLTFRTFLTALSIIGEIRLQLIERQHSLSASERAGLLRQAMAYWNPDAYNRCKEVQSKAEQLMAQLPISPADAEQVRLAASLSGYDADFLHSALPREPVVHLLEEAGRIALDGELLRDNAFTGLTLPQRILARALQPASRRLETEPARDMPLQADKTAQTRSAPDLSPPAGAQQALTPREREVLSLVLRGMSNLEIAAKLYISAHTVKNHVTKILDKLGVSDRTQALAKIYGNRLNTAPGSDTGNKTK